ncbi:hypothetical protein [Chryseobacterium sp. 7]|uniref:hypothetical protein n=1 Tax=Chryseobacterium sp. 7 TaxID=2035214 RepID=UPI001E61D63A|nr:hypothetical protein [Chryseobacterium sp. 7]
MDNDTEIQVVSGLNKNDNIITGYKVLSKNHPADRLKAHSCLKEEVAEIIKTAEVAAEVQDNSN